MSKLVIDLVDEFKSLDEVEDDFELFIMSIKIDDNGEIESTASVEPVSKIVIDDDNQECLFHSVASDNLQTDKAMNIATTIDQISSINPEYALGFADEKPIDDSGVSIDNPIIGFGENIEQRKFFIVCQSF